MPLKMKIRPSSHEGGGLVRRIRRHELRQEGEKEQRHFRVEHIGQRALPEHLTQRDRVTGRRRTGCAIAPGRDSSSWMPMKQR